HHVVCYGKIDVYKKKLQMVSPEYEIINTADDEDSLGLKRIVPIYPLTRGMTQRYIRKVIKKCLDGYLESMTDHLPVRIRNTYKLMNIKRSLSHIHFPEEFPSQQDAIRRISFEEFYFFQISVNLRRLSITQQEGFKHQISDAQTLSFIHAFHFELTGAQKRVIQEIKSDMTQSKPMLRLLQGDVGSGKTLVAFYGCLMAINNGNQTAIMAPTEILARQHYTNITQLIDDKIFPDIHVRILVSTIKKQEKDEIIEELKNGRIDLLIGTHALIYEEVQFKRLSFIVIDEQHKFGVQQRALLTEKGDNPDVLIMTATPIPRTLCITLYGDLDVSTIDELPPNRGAIQTKHVSHDRVEEVYAFVRTILKKKQQAYFVYPLIEESQTLDIKDAENMYKHFKARVFKDFRVGLIHGQMKRSEMEQIMLGFKAKKIDVLVATTVLEWGVDVPNASVMVIEQAERFGLAQLHQLRGRIGRGNLDSHCFLIADPQTQEGQMRLQAICSSRDGFYIAQKDLEIRGPGHYFGRHQHGLNELKVANPATQIDLLELARKEALAVTQSDPNLLMKEHQAMKDVVLKRYPGYLNMVKAG
ncbi:MAG: ATP-dependent DNA helicase RecG, partial [Candidatus Omnitrophica bacterium]|nr:ATP-dependent DNA helicase RecG [Candidatus Omnitrophota bacterium]